MKYKCPYCNGEVKPDDIMFGSCPHCKKVIDGTTVKEEYETNYASSNNKENFIKNKGGEIRNLKKVFAITFLFILLGVAFVKLNGKWGLINKESREEERAKKVVEKWLQAQKRGESGTIYWWGGLAKSLYAVREWEIVNCFVGKDIFGEDTAYVIVRISSSTKGGFPIIKLWKVILKKLKLNGEWIIEDLQEAEESEE